MRTLFCLALFIFLQCNPALCDITVEQAKEKALAFIGEKVELVQGDKRKNCLLFFNEKRGVFISVDMVTGGICSMSWHKRLSYSRNVSMTLEQATKKANELLKLANPPLDNLVMTYATFIDHGDGGQEFSFIWRRQVGGVLYPSSVTMQLSSATGQVGRYELYENKLTLPSLQPQISRERAIEIITPHIKMKPGWEVESAQLSVMPGPPQRLLWNIKVKGLQVSKSPYTGSVGYESIGEYAIDANSGQFLWDLVNRIKPEKKIQLEAPHPSPQKIFAQDSWATWPGNQEKFAFMTFRWLDFGSAEANANERAKAKQKKETLYSTLLVLKTAQGLEALLALPVRASYPVMQRDGKRIAFEMGMSVYVFDLETAIVGQCNDYREQIRTMPDWHPTEKWLAMSGNHSSHNGIYDSDIFVAVIADQLGKTAVSKQWCAAHLPGDDTLPVFSPDGKWIVFAHQNLQTKAKPQSSWSLFKTPSHQKGKPEKIIDLDEEPERLSWPPDGRKILVAYKSVPPFFPRPLDEIPPNRLDLVDVLTKTKTPLQLPLLRDPDLPQGQPLFVKYAGLRPDGKTISFSAVRWSGLLQDAGALCVYSMNLDGSGLQRLTPPEEMFLPSFQYPQRNIKALNAWGKLDPKQAEKKPSKKSSELLQPTRRNH